MIRMFGIPFLYEIVVTSSLKRAVIMGTVGIPILSSVTAWPTTAGEQLLQCPSSTIAAAMPFSFISAHSFGSSSM